MSYRKQRNSSRTSLIISAVFHTALILAIGYLAAKEGILGKQMKTLVATLEKEKKVEPPKPKAEEPKPEQPKPDEAPKVAASAPPPRAEPPPQTVAPPPADNAPAAAPAAVSLPSFSFSDGAKEVQTVSDPKLVYKGLIEHALRSHWNRPEDLEDNAFVVEVELLVDATGKVTSSRWLRGSGNVRWDNSVKAAVAATKVISRAPPKNFPGSCVARFDVESERTQDVLQVTSR
jgi:TonB family protein